MWYKWGLTYSDTEWRKDLSFYFVAFYCHLWLTTHSIGTMQVTSMAHLWYERDSLTKCTGNTVFSLAPWWKCTFIVEGVNCFSFLFILFCNTLLYSFSLCALCCAKIIYQRVFVFVICTLYFNFRSITPLTMTMTVLYVNYTDYIMLSNKNIILWSYGCDQCSLPPGCFVSSERRFCNLST